MGRIKAFALIGLLVVSTACASLSGASDLEIVEDAAAGGASSGGSGGTGGSGGGAGASGSAGASGATPIDYAQGSWQLSNLSSSAGTITHDAQLKFVGSTPFVAWAEPEFGSNSDQDIWAGPIGSVQPITTGTIQFAYPSLAIAGAQGLLAWTSGKDGDQDIYVAMGPNFTSHTNVTTKGDTPTERTDTQGVVASGGGTQAIAYRSSTSFVGELWVATWTSSVTAATLQAVITDKGSCSGPSLVADGAGDLHVLVACGGKAQYASNATGSWNDADVSAGSTGNILPELVLAPDGETLVAIWITGAREILWMRRTLGTIWSTPALVAPNVISATVGVDLQGRILVAFDRRDAENNDNLFFTWFEGGSWAPVMDVTNDGDIEDEHSPSSMTIDPTTGLPVFLYERNEPNSDPLNLDIWRAQFVPGQ